MIQIVPAWTGVPLHHFIALSHEYVTWMMAEVARHYPEVDITHFLAERDYHTIAQKFPGTHTPPDGGLFIALHEDAAVGCVAIGRLNEQVCELRTLFVQPASHGRGIGRKLVDRALSEAQHLHYRYVRLDTLGFMGSALALYRSMGFYSIAPYHPVSETLRHALHFLEYRFAPS